MSIICGADVWDWAQIHRDDQKKSTGVYRQVWNGSDGGKTQWFD